MPRLLDLFCGAGGCSVGYANAGFDVTGVDLQDQPNYPFRFVQADALNIHFIDGYDVIHASRSNRSGAKTSHRIWQTVCDRERTDCTAHKPGLP